MEPTHVVVVRWRTMFNPGFSLAAPLGAKTKNFAVTGNSDYASNGEKATRSMGGIGPAADP